MQRTVRPVRSINNEKLSVKKRKSFYTKTYLVLLGHFLSESQFTAVTPIKKPANPTNADELAADETLPERR